MSDWMGQAECRKHDPELWWSNDPRPAQQICMSCPVIADCLKYALSLGRVDGVWGALTPEGRKMWASRAA